MAENNYYPVFGNLNIKKHYTLQEVKKMFPTNELPKGIVTDVKFNKDDRGLYVKTELQHNTPEILYPVEFPTIDKKTATKENILDAIDNDEYTRALK